MEFYEEARKLGVPDIHITEEEWQTHYNNSYSVLALNGSDMDKILAAQDIIKTYLVLQARQAAQQSVQRTCSRCGSQSFNDYQGYLKCNVCGTIANH